mgnify:CR=1 FL=1
MATVDVKSADFEKLIEGNPIVFVDFWAASEKHADVVFAKVDTESEQEISAAAGITSIPTLMAFRDGILLFRQPGALPAQNLEELISAIKAADMDAIRAEIAAEGSKN